MMMTEYFDCDCSDFRHVFRFVLDADDGELWLEVQLNLWLPWYLRLWHAVRYVFGKPRMYGHYDVTALRKDDFARLQALLARAEQLQQKALEASQKNL